ncbi:MAG TPA: LuxR C-terminal-related transcriptional regulator, partial [Burkholderiales bacterium]|nr:LuxR C-terminal-related transcriptional regulator [Burkholderiales bacterium]
SAPNKVIAAALHLSEHTLRNHLSSIYGKLGINKRVDLVLHAMEHQLAQPSAVLDQDRPARVPRDAVDGQPGAASQVQYQRLGVRPTS